MDALDAYTIRRARLEVALDQFRKATATRDDWQTAVDYAWLPAPAPPLADGTIVTIAENNAVVFQKTPNPHDPNLSWRELSSGIYYDWLGLWAMGTPLVMVAHAITHEPGDDQ